MPRVCGHADLVLDLCRGLCDDCSLDHLQIGEERHQSGCTSLVVVDADSSIDAQFVDEHS